MLRTASVCLFIYWVAIFVATHLPSIALPSVPGSDKVYHALAFTGLSFLLAWALPNRLTMLRHAGTVAIIGISYAFADELTQNFIPGRSCDILDVAADITGVGCGLVAYVIFRRILCGQTWGKRLIRSLSR